MGRIEDVLNRAQSAKEISERVATLCATRISWKVDRRGGGGKPYAGEFYMGDRLFFQTSTNEDTVAEFLADLQAAVETLNIVVEGVFRPIIKKWDGRAQAICDGSAK